VGGHRLLDARAHERRPRSEREVQDTRHLIEVSALVHRLAERLLGRQVVDAADDTAAGARGAQDVVTDRRPVRFVGEAEVEERDLPVSADHHVARRDVPVDDARRVHRDEHVEERRREFQSLAFGECSGALDPVGERLARREGRGDPGALLRHRRRILAGRDDRGDPGMRHPPHRVGLRIERCALRRGLGQLRMQHLDGDAAAV